MSKKEMIKALKAKGISVPKDTEVGAILELYNKNCVEKKEEPANNPEELAIKTGKPKTEAPKTEEKTPEQKAAEEAEKKAAEDLKAKIEATEKTVASADPANLELCDGAKVGQFCDEANDACKACAGDFPDAHAYCKAKAFLEAQKTGKKATARKVSANGSKVRGRFSDFPALVKFLQESKSDGPVIALDKILLEGGTHKAILDKIGALNKEKGWNHCKNSSSIKKHIKFRSDRGWIYEEKDGMVKLTGYKAA